MMETFYMAVDGIRCKTGAIPTVVQDRPFSFEYYLVMGAVFGEGQGTCIRFQPAGDGHIIEVIMEDKELARAQLPGLAATFMTLLEMKRAPRTFENSTAEGR